MKISKDIIITGNCLYLLGKETLIISDLHIGQDESLNKNGFLIPRFQYDDLFRQTQDVVKKHSPKTIILNGDIKHEFSGISKEEWKRVKEYISFLKRKSRVIIVKGNHDAILQPVANTQNIVMKDYVLIDDIFICHGDKIFKNHDFENSKTTIIGHEHPGITLTRGNRMEKYKCFLVGKYERKKLIVMPAMNPTSEGSDVLTQKLLSPYLKKNKELRNFKVIIVEEDKIYDFGKIRDIERTLNQKQN